MFESKYVKLLKEFDNSIYPMIKNYQNTLTSSYLLFGTEADFFVKSYSKLSDDYKKDWEGLYRQYNNIRDLYNSNINIINAFISDYKKYDTYFKKSQFYIMARKGYADLSMASQYTREMVEADMKKLEIYIDKVKNFSKVVSDFKETEKNFFERLKEYQTYIEERGYKYQIASAKKTISNIYGDWKNIGKYAIIVAGIGVIGFYLKPFAKPFLMRMEQKIKAREKKSEQRA